MQDPFDRAKSCCFTGHRPNALPALGKENAEEMQALLILLDRAIVRALEDGITDFYVGGAQGFDMLAAEAVLRCRESDPTLCLRLALPGRDQADGWRERDRARYDEILSCSASVWYAADCWSQESMRRRNRYLVDHSGRCIAYLRRMRGGTLYTVHYALENGIPVDNLAERMMML
jgi:uncharacterized phage-like protein YoqJ